MPGGPDYPHDHSSRFPKAVRDAIRNFAPTTATQGIVHDSAGDVRNWITSNGVTAALRDLKTVLAYLDVADTVGDTRHAEAIDLLFSINVAVARLAATVEAQSQQLNQLTSLLGVEIPQWSTRTEVEEGDEMGLNENPPSAAHLGLVVEYTIHQAEPGYAHEQVMWTAPAAGTLVLRGSTVQVHLNLNG